MKQEENEDNGYRNKRDYEKTALSICELNSEFLRDENVRLQEAKQQHNRIDQEFRKYLMQFSVIKKKEQNIEMIKKIFMKQQQDFDYQLQSEGKQEKEGKKMVKKLQRIQRKAWNLNLDKREDIKVVCNAYEFQDKILDDIAAAIKNYNRD